MAEETLKPISAAKPPVAANPIASATAVHASTLKLKPVIRKPVLGGGAAKPALSGVKPLAKPAATLTPVPPAPAATSAPAPAAAAPVHDLKPDSLDQLKNMTQKLKGVTQQIPAQAILHKTGIIADQGLTEAQKQASKSRTARISLSDAMGVAPVKNEAAPMKTIRIKRPVDLTAPTAPAKPAPAPAAAPEPAAPAAPAAAETSVTQRKTLKIARPGTATHAPTKLGLKKPGATAPAKPTDKPSDGSAPVADIPEVADIPDLPAVPAATAAAPLPKNAVPAVGGAMGVLGLLVSIAACAVVGVVGYLLMVEYQLPLFCGGCS